MSAKFYTIMLLGIFLSGCSKQESRVSLTIPVIHECMETIERVKRHYVLTSTTESYSLDVSIIKFDDVPHNYSGPMGVATLISSGKWNPLDGSEPIKYLQATANGIFADCAPISSLKLNFKDNPELSAKELAFIAKNKGVSEIVVSEDGVLINYNDGSYQYPF